MMTTEISTAREQQLFNGKNFHVVIYNKTESVSGLHQHDYYEFTVVLTGRYYQEINGKRVLLERGDFVFIPMGSHHQSFYEFGADAAGRRTHGAGKSIGAAAFFEALPGKLPRQNHLVLFRLHAGAALGAGTGALPL